MKKLNFAIYGCGVIAKTHTAAIRNVRGAELFGCCDYNPSVAEEFSKKEKIRFFKSFEDLLESDEVDVISICTPSGTHAPLAVKALLFGKHVVLEKPMAISVSGCDEIISAAEKTGAKITVISQMRTSPDVIRAKKIIEDGSLGTLILCELNMRYWREESYYRGSWRGTRKMDGGGALMNQGIHGVDLLLYLVGNIKNIQSTVRTLYHDIEVEDTAVASLEFDTGALGVITASTATNPGFDREIKIYGTRGALELREDRLTGILIDGVREELPEFVSVGGAGNNTLVDSAAHTRQILDFVRVIQGEDIPYVDQHEGKRAVEIIETIYKRSI